MYFYAIEERAKKGDETNKIEKIQLLFNIIFLMSDNHKDRKLPSNAIIHCNRRKTPKFV